MESKGWEFEIGGDIIRTKDFTWNSNLNLGHNSGKILTLWGNNTYYNGNGFPAPGSPGDAARIEEGSTIGAFYLGSLQDSTMMENSYSTTKKEK